MTCRFAHDDAAYVLGALSPGERLDFERHLATCDDCTRSVRELAGLPGLLGRIEASVLDQLDHPPDDPVPDTLLPALARRVRRTRRRSTLVAVGSAVAAAALAVALVASQLGGGATSGDPESEAAPPETPAQAMTTVGEVPVEASLALEEVTWGTRLGLVCTYDPGSVTFPLPPELDYLIFVRTRDGRVEQVGSWRSVEGRTMQITAATAASREDIESVEVRAPDGRVVLTLVA